MTDQFDADVRRWLLTGDLPCLECGYNLRGLVGPIVQCPECGRHNDLRHSDAWQTKQLPLGVRTRQHWPATSVALSFLVVSFTPVALFAPLGWIPSLFFTILWLWTCVRWVRSARDKAWSIGMLMATHVAVWSFGVGMLACVIFFTEKRLVSAVPAIGLVLLGLLGTLWIIRTIDRADRSGQFRQDWRTWRIPIASP